MKISKKTKLILIAIPVVVIVALMSFTLANNIINNTANKLFTRNRTSIILEQQEDPTKVDVYLEMDDNASIASFQIGLNIDVSEDYNAKFDWSKELSNNTEKFRDVKIHEDKDIDTGKEIERVNIYYVGTKELNELSDNVDIDNIKIGTITLESEKDEEGNPVNKYGSTLLIRPIGTDENETTTTDEDFTKTVSISHEVKSVKVDDDDILRTEIPGTIVADQNEQNPNSGNQNDQNQQNPGSESQNDPNQQNPNSENQNPNNTNSNGGYNTEGSSNNSNNEKSNNNSPSIKSVKTGADHSNIWIIVSIAVLVVIASIIIFVKVKSKKSKH